MTDHIDSVTDPKAGIIIYQMCTIYDHITGVQRLGWR